MKDKNQETSYIKYQLLEVELEKKELKITPGKDIMLFENWKVKSRITNSPVFFIIILLTIYQSANSQEILDYDINIRYSQMKEIIDSRFSQQLEVKYQDSVLLFFEGGFSNHNVAIKVNGKAYASDNITSNEVLDFAKEYNIGRINDINFIEISLDRGPNIYIQPDGIRKLISLNYFDNVVTVEFMNNQPYYD